MAWMGAPRSTRPAARSLEASKVDGTSARPSGWRYEWSVCGSGRMVARLSAKPLAALSVVPATNMASTMLNSGRYSSPVGKTFLSPALLSYMKPWILNRTVMPTASSKLLSSTRAPLSNLPSLSKVKPRTLRMALRPRSSARSRTSKSGLASGGRTDFSLLLLGFFHGA